MIRANPGKAVMILIVGILIAALAAQAEPAAADDGTSINAQVEVLEKEEITYAARIAASWNTWWTWWATGKPDGRGATILYNGWISLELKDGVIDAGKVVVRAAKRGWGHSSIKVWVSADGRHWKLAGSAGIFSNEFQDYEFNVSVNVKYIKIERNGGPWSWLILDAAGAGGGENDS